MAATFTVVKGCSLSGGVRLVTWTILASLPGFRLVTWTTLASTPGVRMVTWTVLASLSVVRLVTGPYRLSSTGVLTANSCGEKWGQPYLRGRPPAVDGFAARAHFLHQLQLVFVGQVVHLHQVVLLRHHDEPRPGLVVVEEHFTQRKGEHLLLG
jgi:hypothetical protein